MMKLSTSFFVANKSKFDQIVKTWQFQWAFFGQSHWECPQQVGLGLGLTQKCSNDFKQNDWHVVFKAKTIWHKCQQKRFFPKSFKMSKQVSPSLGLKQRCSNEPFFITKNHWQILENKNYCTKILYRGLWECMP